MRLSTGTVDLGVLTRKGLKIIRNACKISRDGNALHFKMHIKYSGSHWREESENDDFSRGKLLVKVIIAKYV